jgi:monoamine oxidase
VAAGRARAVTAHDNLVLAGDWTATGLPSTIEGAIRSGTTAAQALLKGARGRGEAMTRGAA